MRLHPALTLHGYGHYYENYAKIDGHWRITSSKLTRLREDLGVKFVPTRVAVRLRAAAARIARRSSNVK